MFIATSLNNRDRIERILRYDYLPKSRFTCRFEVERVPRSISRQPWQDSIALRLRLIRLRHKHYYCGQHPGPCPINPYFQKKHPFTALLEGSDWVAFDDMLNDLCDRFKIEAVIWSKGQEFRRRFFIRRGCRRRMNYPAYGDSDGVVEFYGWDCDESLAAWDDSHFGVYRDAPRSEFMAGTPGVAEWRMSRGRKLEDLILADDRKERGLKPLRKRRTA